jgi:hypothetical protein
MRTALVVVGILFASWLTGFVSHSMYAFTTVLGSASLVAIILKIDSVAKRRAQRRRLAWDAAYQHNASAVGHPDGTFGRYRPPQSFRTEALGQFAAPAEHFGPINPPMTAGQAWDKWHEGTRRP